MIFNKFGTIVQSCWEQIPCHFIDIQTDAFIIMPNHIHGIIIMNGRGTACRAPTESFGKPAMHSLPTIIRSFKSAATKQINNLRRMPGSTVWQRNYYERVIRDEDELNEVRQYILSNPMKWELDRENPEYRQSG